MLVSFTADHECCISQAFGLVGAELGEGLHDRRGERAEVVQLFGDDGMDHIEIQTGVFMHGHVTEADHPLHVGHQLGRQNPGSLQEGKGVTAVLRNTETPPADDVHGEVDRGFTGALKIADDRILFGLIYDEILVVLGYSSRIRWRQRSMLAAFLRTTSSAIDQPALGDPFHDLPPFLVEPGIV